MEHTNRYDGIDEYAVRLIRYKAKRLIGTVGFTEDDRNDIEQELVLDLLRRLPKYNRDKAQLNTFIARLVEHKIDSIIESRTAGLRDYRLCSRSLNDRIADDDGNSTERVETINQDDYLLRTGTQHRPSTEQFDFVLDILRVIDRLPPDLKVLCKRLAQYSVTEISRETGVPRGTIYESIARLRKIFEINGLKEYI